MQSVKSLFNVKQLDWKSSNLSFVIPMIVLLAMTVGMFADVIIPSSTKVLSWAECDLRFQFVYWRDFGFGQIRQGNFPLWNPHIFSGAPYFGGFQSALLYPPNLIYLILPIEKAINVGIMLHVFLAGVFMYLWTSHRGLRPTACLVSSGLLMFCHPHFLHIFAGHLPNLCTLVWAPLIFLAIDGFFKKCSLGWILLGIFAITMQILAGHPQYVFYTGVAAALYSAFCLISCRQRFRIVLGLSGMYAGAIALSAVQLLTGIQAAGESIRSIGLDFTVASLFAFPPENMATLLAPGFFGDSLHFPYWGRHTVWEMSLFIGVTGLFLAIYGAIRGDRSIRRHSIAMVLILMILALGAYTPLFQVLHAYVFGFDKFRGMSKFVFQASLFLIMLSAIGLDRLIRSGPASRTTCAVILITGIVIGFAGIVMRHSGMGGALETWQEIMGSINATGESYIPSWKYADDQFIREAGHFASKSLVFCGATCVLLSSVLFLLRVSRRMMFLLAALALIEVVVFAARARPTFDLGLTGIPEMAAPSADYQGGYRILNPLNPNSAMSWGNEDLWGLDPGVLMRYAEFMAFTQGLNPDNVNQDLGFSRPHRLYSMLRCRHVYIYMPNTNGVKEFAAKERALVPRLQLIDDYRVMSGRDDIFSAMSSPQFDPRKMVILEQSPQPKPKRGSADGTVRLLDSSTDHLTIEAELPYPKILVITDNYAKGWQALALQGSDQEEYDVLPANYILRAIPLSAGHHRLRVEYLPLAFTVGKWISIFSAVIYIGAIVWHRRKSRI
jgi:hypothetical protein